MSSEHDRSEPDWLLQGSVQARLAYIFALDPRAASMFVNTEAARAYPAERNAYATVSDLPTHLKLAEVLSEFLEADTVKHDAMLAFAELALERGRATDEAFSKFDISQAGEQ